jgi:thymidylate synthase
MENNVIVKTNTLDEAWMDWYNVISAMHTLESSRDGEVIGEVINAITEIEDPTKNIMKNQVRKLSMRYAIGEMLWYLSENNSLSAIKNYTNAWDRMSDDGLTVNSNYGYCIHKKYGFDQWKYIKQMLIEHPETRQAIMHIKTADDVNSNDVNCTICLQFFIRNGKLYMTTYMRSNDLWMGFPYDVFQFTCMQIRMAMELNVGIGTYTHIAGSLHLYKRDYEKALENERQINERQN